MKISLSIFIISTLFASMQVKSSDFQIETVEDVKRVISIYREARTSEAGFAAMAALMSFVENSDLVFVEIKEDTLPWVMDAQINDELRHLMLAAYVIGNVDEQIKTNTKQNKHCAGALEVTQLIEQIEHSLPTAQVKLAKARVVQSKQVGSCNKT